MSQFGSPAYEVERPTGVCSMTGRALEPGEAYMATLCETPPEQPGGLGLRRLDISMEAWRDGGRPEGIFSYWKATVNPPNRKKKVFVDDNLLLSLFARLGEPDQKHRAPFRFVLGLILMRKRLIRHVDTRIEEVADLEPEAASAPACDEPLAREDAPSVPSAPVRREFWVVTVRGESEPVELLDPKLDDQRIEEVMDELNQILDLDESA
ncbi:MAG: hypothetical protein JJU36_12985 [Phycisphaeraceae bacterium]|nr:hypothetical protein [Phycisphaeraceae bacterium]